MVFPIRVVCFGVSSGTSSIRNTGSRGTNGGKRYFNFIPNSPIEQPLKAHLHIQFLLRFSPFDRWVRAKVLNALMDKGYSFLKSCSNFARVTPISAQNLQGYIFHILQPLAMKFNFWTFYWFCDDAPF